MFESLRVRNFRSIRDSGEIHLSDLNVFVGPNNSGKSSILYALMLVKMTLAEKDVGTPLITSTPELDLGSYLDLIRGHDGERKLMIKFTLDKAVQTPFPFVGMRGLEEREGYGSCRVEFRFDKSRNAVEVMSFSGKSFSGENILSVTRRSDNKWKITGIPRKLLNHTDVSFENFIPVIIPYGPRPKPTLIEEVLKWFLTSRTLVENLVDVLEGLKYIAPIRERIPRHSIIGTMSYSELGPSGENLMRVLSSSALIGRRKKTAIDEVNYWLDRKFKLLKNVRMMDIDKAGTVKTLIGDDPKGGKGINLASMGCGISQLVPVVVQTVLMPDSGCLLVEQPEIHLHPSAQADLADLFVENAKRKRQFVIETHSEHFVLRLRRRIAEGRIKAEKVNIFFVEKIRNETRVRPLPLKPDGHFVEWPKGFFEEGFNEALAIAEAGYTKE